MQRITKTAIGLSFLALLACSGQLPIDVPGVGGGGPDISVELSTDQQAAAEELTGRVKDGHFPFEDRNNVDNGEIFLWLAATSEVPEVIGASLEGMYQRYSSAEIEGKLLVDSDYQAVTRFYLEHDDAFVQGRAMEAVDHGLRGESPDAEAAATLSRLATEHADPAGRFAALDALANYSSWQKDEAAAGAFLAALDDDTNYVISEALYRLQFATFGLVEPDGFMDAGRKLLEHDDEGVRGRAVLFVGRLAEDDDDEVWELVHGMLDDDSGFVRSEAADAASAMHRLEAVHKLIMMVRDDAANTYDIDGWTQLDGDDGRLHHDGSPWDRVDDAALRAIESVTFAMGDDKFDYPDVSPKTKEDDIASAASAAESWYRKHRNDLPDHPDKAAAAAALGKGGGATRKKSNPGGRRTRQ